MISMGSLSRKAPEDRSYSPISCAPKLSSRSAIPCTFHDYALKVGSPDAELMLTRPSYGAWRISQHRLGCIVVQSGGTGGATIYNGAAQPGSFEFLIREPGEMHAMRLNGQLVSDDAIAVLPPGKPIVLACLGPYRWMSLSVRPQVMTEAGFTPAQLHQLAAGPCIIKPSSAAARRLATAMIEAIDLVRNKPISSWIDCFSLVERDLLTNLVAAACGDDLLIHATSRNSNGSLDLINRQALALIRSRDELDLNVESLCRAINVAERRLLRAFHRYFEIGPTQYMKLRRLNRMHRELQARACGETTVTGVMTNCGVTEFGRFAGAYRALFGESPSETLRGKLAAADRVQANAGTAAGQRRIAEPTPGSRRFLEMAQPHAMA
jgi:AraC family transcriptional regulator, ethanolamine operon transcriptional activator